VANKEAASLSDIKNREISLNNYTLPKTGFLALTSFWHFNQSWFCFGGFDIKKIVVAFEKRLVSFKEEILAVIIECIVILEIKYIFALFSKHFYNFAAKLQGLT